MRLSRFLSLINERYEEIEIGRETFEYLVDPSGPEISAFLGYARHRSLRGVYIHGHSYWWDAYNTTHDWGINALYDNGVKFNPSSTGFGPGHADGYMVMAATPEGLEAADGHPRMAKWVGPYLLQWTTYGDYRVGPPEDGAFAAMVRGLKRIKLSESMMPLIENPTARQLAGYLQRISEGEVRGFIDLSTGNYFVWPSSTGTHGQGYTSAIQQGSMQRGAAPVFFMASSRRQTRADTKWTAYAKQYGPIWISFHPVSEPSDAQKGELWGMLLSGLKRMKIELSMNEATAQTAPGFAEWFAGSKVVDAEGKPQPMFHGSNGPFEGRQFRPLTHFGTVDSANDRLKWQVKHKLATQQHVFPVYISMKNPIRMGDTQALQGFGFGLAETMARKKIIPKTDLPRLKSEYDALNRGGPGKNYAPDQRWYDEINAHLKKVADLWEKHFVQYLSDLGYDGIIYKNRIEGRGADSYIIFRPDQVWPIFGSRPGQINESTETIDGVLTYINPSRAQLIGLTTKHSLRGMVLHDTTFVWNAAEATHMEMFEAMGYDEHVFVRVSQGTFVVFNTVVSGPGGDMDEWLIEENSAGYLDENTILVVDGGRFRSILTAYRAKPIQTAQSE